MGFLWEDFDYFKSQYFEDIIRNLKANDKFQKFSFQWGDIVSDDRKMDKIVSHREINDQLLNIFEEVT